MRGACYLCMKPSITVLGPLPKQIEVIKNRFRKSNIRLKFSKTNIPTSGDIVVWTDFVSHSMTRSAEQAVGRDHVHLYCGGLGGLADLIEEIATVAV